MMEGRKEMAAHLEDEHGDGERDPDPEAARHIDELGARASVGGRDLRFERHAADRAGAGMVLADLGVHRAGPDRAWRSFRSRLLAIAQIAFGVGEELHPAACAAKMKVVSRMGSMVRRPLRIDGHPTNRILCLGR